MEFCGKALTKIIGCFIQFNLQQYYIEIQRIGNMYVKLYCSLRIVKEGLKCWNCHYATNVKELPIIND